jgi:hypothetical protein
MIERKRRHPFRGLFFGLLLGLGVGLLAIVYGWYFLGNLTPWILVALFTILGLLVAFVPRPWGRRQPPPTATT